LDEKVFTGLSGSLLESWEAIKNDATFPKSIFSDE